MFCSECGTENDESAKFCKSCGYMLKEDRFEQNNQNFNKNYAINDINTKSYEQKEYVYNYVVPNIIATIMLTLCCCSPFGLLAIVGIVYGTQVEGKLKAGLVEEAKNSAKWAKIWLIITIIVSVLSFVGMMLLGIVSDLIDNTYY